MAWVGGTGGVDLRIGTFGANKLSELRVSHRQNLKEEASIKAPVGLAVVLEVVDEIGVAGKCTSKDDSGVCTHGLWQLPSNQLLLAC